MIADAADKMSDAQTQSEIRNPKDVEVEHLARLWFDGWQDAHSQILPRDLARLRTIDSFRDRLRDALPNVRVVGPEGAPAGFAMTRGDELYQLYVSAAARGTGAAAALIADALRRFRADGVETAWLSCAIGNDRAARFYEKCGWRRVGTMTDSLETPARSFALQVWRYEISVTD